MEHKLSAVQVLLHTCSIEIIALKKKGVPIFKAFRKGAGTPPRVALHIERKAQTVNRVGSGREGTKLRDLEAKYPKEKAQKLAALLKSRGLWHWDPDFPNDEEEWSSEINTLYLNIRINLVHLKPYQRY